MRKTCVKCGEVKPQHDFRWKEIPQSYTMACKKCLHAAEVEYRNKLRRERHGASVKQCNKCKTLKPYSEFSECQTWCLECHQSAAAYWRVERKPHIENLDLAIAAKSDPAAKPPRIGRPKGGLLGMWQFSGFLDETRDDKMERLRMNANLVDDFVRDNPGCLG